MAEKKEFISDGKINPKIKATEITNWLKEEFELGHGHAMAIYATFKGKTEWQKMKYNFLHIIRMTEVAFNMKWGGKRCN